MKIALYITLFNEYDNLTRISNGCSFDNIDFYCITDLKEKTPGWNKMFVNNYIGNSYDKFAKTGKYYKLHPDKFFSDYDLNVYIDARVTSVDFERLMEHCNLLVNSDKSLLIPKLPKENTLEEINGIIQLRREKKETLIKQYDGYIKEGFKDNIQLVQTNFQIRKSNNKELKNFFEIWWNEIKYKSYRDQVSYAYSIWRSGFNKIKLISADERRKVTKFGNHRKAINDKMFGR